MEAIHSSETSVNARSTQRHIPEDDILQSLHCCLSIRCRGNLFTKSLPSNEPLLWLRYSGFQTSCHNMVLSSIISYRSKQVIIVEYNAVQSAEVNQRFRGTGRLNLPGRRISQARPKHLCLLPASRSFLAWLILRTWRWRRYVQPKCWLTFNGLHSAVSQKTEFFITAAVRTWSPTKLLIQ
jgi:hypothetical protein